MEENNFIDYEVIHKGKNSILLFNGKNLVCVSESPMGYLARKVYIDEVVLCSE